MAYCVNCGVELAPSEKTCPLCGIEAINPASPWQEPARYPYPKHVEELPGRINVRFGAQLATILLAIPVAVTLLIDLLQFGSMTWSSYVLGAGFCLFVIVLLPLYWQIRRPYAYLALDGIAAALYLLLIGWRTGGMDWVSALGLPLVLTAGAGLMGEVYLARRPGKGLCDLLSEISVIGAAQLIAVEMLIDHFLFGQIQLTWSLYALVPLLALAAVFRIVERRKKLKESILKRLFI